MTITRPAIPRRTLLATVVALGILTMVAPPATSGPPYRGPYLIATEAQGFDGVVLGGQEFAESAEAVLCRYADSALQECIRTPEFDEDASGTIVWVVPSGPEYDAIVAMLTNGLPDQLTSGPAFGGSGARGGGVWSEEDFFAGTARPNGIDLRGYRISRIGLRVDSVSLVSPGSDPNGDGVWTDLDLTARWVVEGTIVPKACKGGGWRDLRGPGGREFRNQRECVAFASGRH